MNGIFLIIPLFVVRFGLIRFFDKKAKQRADYFPPTQGKEKIAYWINMITNLILCFGTILFTISRFSTLIWIGLGFYLLGILLYTIILFQFAKPNAIGINMTGFYRFSRNPMYLAYFIYFLGITLMFMSWWYGMVLLIFQISVHWLILSEERWCLEQFGENYQNYMKKVRRYL